QQLVAVDDEPRPWRDPVIAAAIDDEEIAVAETTTPVRANEDAAVILLLRTRSGGVSRGDDRQHEWLQVIADVDSVAGVGDGGERHLLVNRVHPEPAGCPGDRRPLAAGRVVAVGEDAAQI